MSDLDTIEDALDGESHASSEQMTVEAEGEEGEMVHLNDGRAVLQSTASFIDELESVDEIFTLRPEEVEEALPEEYEVRNGKLWVECQDERAEQTSLTELKKDIIRAMRNLPAAKTGGIVREVGTSHTHVNRCKQHFLPLIRDDVLYEYFVQSRRDPVVPTEEEEEETLDESNHEVDDGCGCPTGGDDVQLEEPVTPTSTLDEMMENFETEEESSASEEEATGVLISDEEEMFEIISGLIKSGNEEKASQLFGRW